MVKIYKIFFAHFNIRIFVLKYPTFKGAALKMKNLMPMIKKSHVT